MSNPDPNLPSAWQWDEDSQRWKAAAPIKAKAKSRRSFSTTALAVFLVLTLVESIGFVDSLLHPEGVNRAAELGDIGPYLLGMIVAYRLVRLEDR